MRLSQIGFRQIALVGTVAASVLLTACGTFGNNQPKPPNQGTPVSAAGDPLRVGDKIKVDLTTGIPGTQPSIHEEEIKADGSINVEHIGAVEAAGKTPREIEQEIHSRLVPAYYQRMIVTITPLDRFFYVGGQVNRPSQQPYAGSMTVSRAIQAAGDFTDFANRKKIQVIRFKGQTEVVNYYKIMENPELDPPIYPGDKIEVRRRWW